MIFKQAKLPPAKLFSLMLAFAFIGSGVLRQSAFAIGEDDPLWTKPSYEKKITAIGFKLLEAGDIDENITFSLGYRRYDEKSNVNARASSFDGHVVVESGILKFVESDDEIAFILGHEIGHILARDSHKRRAAYIASSLFITAPLTVVGFAAGPAGSILGGYLGNKASRSLSNVSGQGREIRADLLGLQLMSKAGYDPKKALTMARKIFSDGEMLKVNRSHPMGKERMAQIRKYIKAQTALVNREAESPESLEALQAKLDALKKQVEEAQQEKAALEEPWPAEQKQEETTTASSTTTTGNTNEAQAETAQVDTSDEMILDEPESPVTLLEFEE
ncbi:MAG: M48 family metalloprotease [Vampirovibrionales bacterium]|nr:M48 family metalloprotease [Vampirovibrionales bacterium]